MIVLRTSIKFLLLYCSFLFLVLLRSTEAMNGWSGKILLAILILPNVITDYLHITYNNFFFNYYKS